MLDLTAYPILDLLLTAIVAGFGLAIGWWLWGLITTQFTRRAPSA